MALGARGLFLRKKKNSECGEGNQKSEIRKRKAESREQGAERMALGARGRF
ncbi:MAG: hypothetical protein Kow0037_28400 [Calditrichia bacterium]